MIVDNIVNIVGNILNSVLPDNKAKEKALFEIEAKLQEALTKENLGQIEINKIEASNNNLFVAGWRPCLGWVCTIAVFWSFILAPLLAWLVNLFGLPVELPVLETGQLMQLILGMLGLGSLRTFEKIKGVAK